MQLDKNIYISVIDLMLLLIIMLLLSLLSIRYDADKGIGEKDLITIRKIEADNKKAVNNKISSYNALLIDNKSIEIVKIKHGIKKEKKVFLDYKEMLNEINKDEIYVIYEKERSRFLGDVIRSLVKLNVNILIAKSK